MPRLDGAHRYARESGGAGALYRCVRVVAGGILRLWFRPLIKGAERIPAEGPVVVVCNHKSFLDAFFIALATKRRVRFMVKSEIFRGPLRPLLPRLGAFPVVREAGDTAAFDTCLALLRQGELVVVFPEGTRVDEDDALAAPHHGAARLAIAAGAPIVPGAIAGTARLWMGPVPKPRRVRLAFLPPVAPGPGESPEDVLDGLIWPEVLEEYGRLRAASGLIAGALAGIGIGAGVAAARRRRERPPRLLGKLGPKRQRKRGIVARLRR